MREIHFVCAFCGEDVNPEDEEACQIAVIHPMPEHALQTIEPQYFFAHRKPCFEGVMHVDVRGSLGLEE